MKTFLEFVANDLIEKLGTSLAHIAIVFPNKRASLFMNDYLYERIGQTMWGPQYLTISELFRSKSSLIIPDQIQLISELYDCYKNVTKSTESLDHFYSWGQVLLADFDDIDKNMADASQIFKNISSVNELTNNDYLTQEQIAVLRHFFAEFKEESQLKSAFSQLWNNLFDIYTSFKSTLISHGEAYEGMLYRKVIEDQTEFGEYDKYVFVGFNFLDVAEKKLFGEIKKSGKALFYWDYDVTYLQERLNLASDPGGFVMQNMDAFPNALDQTRNDVFDNLSKKKDITFVSAVSDNLQTRYIKDWLTENHNERLKAGRRTAIVLADEHLLLAVNHSLPSCSDENDDNSDFEYQVNITTGYPLSATPIVSLAEVLIQLQTEGFLSQQEQYRSKHIKKVLSHPYAHYISSLCPTLRDKIEKENLFAYDIKDLTMDDSLQLLFGNPIIANKDNQVDRLNNWLSNILRTIASNSTDNVDPLYRESLYRLFTLINRFTDLHKNGYLKIEIPTYLSLLRQVIVTTTIPFHGEPAIGLQIMGVLETRNLDFDHLLILSCNEGNIPKGLTDNSFIPYNIRKAFGLTTTDGKVGMYAYHFYRLIQRTSDITIIYNNSTEDGHTGEMSRFMLQMMVSDKYQIKRKRLLADLQSHSASPCELAKSPAIMAALNGMEFLSPTAINRYIACNLKFYYANIVGIKEPEDSNVDDVGNRTFGNIYHRAAELIYLSMAPATSLSTIDGATRLIHPYRVSKDALCYVLDKTVITRFVDQAFNEELFKTKEKNNRHKLNGLQLINRKVIIDYLHSMLKKDEQMAPFDILGLEVKVPYQLCLSDADNLVIQSGGIIDRMDKVIIDGQEAIRIVDYKTGRPPHEKVKSVESVFSTDNIRATHSSYYLQTMLYACAVSASEELNPHELPVSPHLLFIQKMNASDYDSMLEIGKEKLTDIRPYSTEFEELLKKTVEELYNDQIPFRPTSNREDCLQCPYKTICHQHKTSN